MRSSDALHPTMSGSTGFALCIFGVLVFASLMQAENNHGTPGVDYPNYHSVPETSFSCSEQKYIPGFYADLESKCQAFHFCFQDHQESFLCPTGTIFNQAILACDNWFNSNCSLSPLFYDVNVGPVMENAGRKLPILLKLRSRTQSKTSKPESLAPVKDELLSSEIESKHAEGVLNEVADVLSTGENIDGIKTKAINEPLNSNNKIADLSDNEQIDYGVNLPEEKSVGDEADKLVYDPVTDAYYTNDGPYEGDWQDSANDEFSQFYKHGDRYVQESRSSSMFNDYIGGDEINADRIKGFRGNWNAREFNPSEFSKRMQISHSRRVRRKPVYVMVPDESEVDLAGRELLFSDDPDASDSVVGDVSESPDSTGPGEGISTESPFESTTRGEPFPRPTRIPPHLLELNTPTPMSTEQFGAAIFSELVEPYLPDNYGTLIASTYDQPQTEEPSPSEETEEPQGEPADLQGDDESVYVEVIPEQTGYETYVSEYGSQGTINDPESAYKLRMLPKSDTQYETAQETDSDTFVVIPDADSEIESDSDEDLNANYLAKEYEDQAIGYQVDGNGQIIADYGQYGNAYNYESNAYLPESHESDPASHSQYVRSIPKTWSNQELPHDAVNSDANYISTFPYANDGRAYMTESNGFETYTPEMTRICQRYMNDHMRNYRQQHQANDGSFSEQPYYVNLYNPYLENEQMQYDESMYSEYLDSKDTEWVEQNEMAEMPGVLEVTDSPLPLPVTDADLDLVSEHLGENLISDAVPEESANQNEDLYVFDEEVQTSYREGSPNKRVEPEESILDHGQDLRISEMPTLNGSSDAPSHNVSLNANESPHSGKTTDDFSLNALLVSSEDPTRSASVSHNVKANFKPLDTSAHVADSFLGDAATGSTVGRFSSQGIGSKSEGLGMSSDSGYLNNMGYPESMDFGPYGFGANMGQQYSMMESLQPAKTRTTFSHRTGEGDQSRLSKLSAFQERMRSMKQGKFGAFKKYISSSKD